MTPLEQQLLEGWRADAAVGRQCNQAAYAARAAMRDQGAAA